MEIQENKPETQETKPKKVNKTADMKAYQKAYREQYKKVHKNEEREYNAKYYKENKSRLLQSQICTVCGGCFSIVTKGKHMRSKHHAKHLLLSQQQPQKTPDHIISDELVTEIRQLPYEKIIDTIHYLANKVL